MAAIVISLANQKGGVGKTTSTLNLGSALATSGKRVLLIDMDPQASLTISCGIEPDSCEKTISDVMLKYGGRARAKIAETIIALESNENLFLAPAVIDLAAADTLLLQELGRERILAKAVAEVKEYFDYILIDCPPSLNQLFINALVASDYILIPVGCDYLAYRGLVLLQETIENIRESLNGDLKILGVIATFHNNTIHARENLENLAQRYNVIGVVDTTVRAKDALYSGRPIVETDPDSKVSVQYKEIAGRMLASAT